MKKKKVRKNAKEKWKTNDTLLPFHSLFFLPHYSEDILSLSESVCNEWMEKRDKVKNDFTNFALFSISFRLLSSICVLFSCDPYSNNIVHMRCSQEQQMNKITSFPASFDIFLQDR